MDLSIRNQIVYILLHSIVSISKMTKLSRCIKQEKLITFLAVYDITKNSVLLDKIVTVSYLLAPYTIAPPNNFMI